MKRILSVSLAVLVLMLALLTAAACGGDDNGDDSDNGTSPTTAASPGGDDGDNGDNGDDTDDGDDDGDDADDGVLTLVAKNTLFDKSELSAEAGEVTIELDNQDAGIVHNIHVYKGSDATGEDMGMTELEAGPVKQTLTLTLEPGEYFYVCDAHPATMTGTLTVE